MMSREAQGAKPRGSQKWLQMLVNQRPELVNRILAQQIGLSHPNHVRWLSPLEGDDFSEYRDQDFLDRLGVTCKVPLKDFWPRHGPQWDALAATGRGDLILVEAKAHIAELVSAPTGAKGRSLALIRKSLAATKQFVHSHADADWDRCFYQYTNRLAHLYYLRESNGLPAYLLNIYFVGDADVDGPATEDEWKGAIKLLETFLGIHEKHALSKFELKVFVRVADLVS